MSSHWHTVYRYCAVTFYDLAISWVLCYQVSLYCARQLSWPFVDCTIGMRELGWDLVMYLIYAKRVDFCQVNLRGQVGPIAH